MATNENDRAVLNSIFNPLLPVGEIFTDEFQLPENQEDIEEEVNEDGKEAKKLEMKGVALAESGDLKSALELFTAAINKSPKRASGYNNRAQVYRLQGRTADAMADLDFAIELSGGGKGRSGSQALCQRALLKLRAEKKADAAKDFTEAARNGNAFAKAQLVKLNPYAALCNQMLSIVMATLNNPTTETGSNK